MTIRNDCRNHDLNLLPACYYLLIHCTYYTGILLCSNDSFATSDHHQLGHWPSGLRESETKLESRQIDKMPPLFSPFPHCTPKVKKLKENQLEIWQDQECIYLQNLLEWHNNLDSSCFPKKWSSDRLIQEKMSCHLWRKVTKESFSLLSSTSFSILTNSGLLFIKLSN